MVNLGIIPELVREVNQGKDKIQIYKIEDLYCYSLELYTDNGKYAAHKDSNLGFGSSLDAEYYAMLDLQNKLN